MKYLLDKFEFMCYNIYKKRGKEFLLNKRNEVVTMAGITRVRKNKVPAHIMDWAWSAHQEVTRNCDRFFITATTMHSVKMTVCVDLETGKSGVARCHPEDIFNPIIGRAIAYARCRGYEIPKWTTYKTMEEMTNGEKFKLNGKIYTFIGYLKEYDHIAGAKVYVISENEHDVTRFVTMPDEKYEMVE